MRRLQTVLLASTAFLAVPAVAVQAQSITPDAVTATIGIGETLTINKTITLAAGGATTVDVFFVIDDTGSMGGIINQAKAGATAIMNGLPDTYQFGVASYDGEPAEGVPANIAYSVKQGLTFDKAAAQAGINNIFASGGGDFPEGNFNALARTANEAAWRPEAQRIIVWFGDAPSHTRTIGEAATIAALNAAGVTVIAFNSRDINNGLNAAASGNPSMQATRVTDATGGSLTNNFSALTGDDFVDAVTDKITETTSTIDLVFGHTFVGTGLDIAITCTDGAGCDDVAGGESRTFDVAITGVEAGTYDFEVFARGVDAVETDLITVTGGPVGVPEPGSLLLLGTGLLGLAARRRRTLIEA